MTKPRIFLGSSGKQAKLLQAITRGLEDVADVEPWTTTFKPDQTIPPDAKRQFSARMGAHNHRGSDESRGDGLAP
jgi:hypothetical protein